jgi:hypothetical protein
MSVDENLSILDLDTVNDEEVIGTVDKIENLLINWTIPTEKFSKIYQKEVFDLVQDFSIKTTERTISIDKPHGPIQLFSQQAIDYYKKRKFRYLHIGLVQVAVKPLYRLGCDTSICLLLKDARRLNFKNSLLAILESNTCYGPVYFNCYQIFY